MGLKALNEELGKVQARVSELAGMETRSAEESTELAEKVATATKIKEEIDLEKRASEVLTYTASTPIVEERSEKTMKTTNKIVADFIRGNAMEMRAGENTVASTGSVVPTEFSDDIIKQVKELCGIINQVSVVNSKGTYKQIVADTEDKISAGWTSEIGEITASTAKFSIIEIGHQKLTALVKLSLELINQNAFDIVGEVTAQMVEDFALKLEQAILTGDGEGKPTGLTTGGTAYTLASATSVTADDIVKIFHTLKAPYQTNAVWIMNNATLCAIRLLQDGAGRYVFHQAENLAGGYVGTILGKPVLVSETMADIESGAQPILFGDFARAYKVNLNPDMTMQVLNEKYAEYGMKGVVGIVWADGKPVNDDAYVTVTAGA